MDKVTEYKIKRRQASNRTLVKLISDMVETSPDLRFHQILHALGVEKQNAPGTCEDLFYEESTDTLDRVSESIEKMK